MNISTQEKNQKKQKPAKSNNSESPAKYSLQTKNASFRLIGQLIGSRIRC